MERHIFGVSEVNRLVKLLLDQEPLLQEILIRGELSNYKIYPSGHHYFTLKDPEGALRCVMFRGSAGKLRFRPENGMKVVAGGRITVFPRDGAYQLYCSTLEPEGAGDLAVAYEQLKARLGEEGLFDPAHKKPLPLYPERIAVMGLYHDFTEIITGDLPTPVKYRNDKIKSAFKEIEEEAAQELLERLPEDLRGEYAPYLQESEWTPEEYKLVKAADKLSALIKCIEEQKAGNQEFQKAKEASETYLRDMNCPEADVFCQEFLPHYYKTLDEL